MNSRDFKEQVVAFRKAETERYESAALKHRERSKELKTLQKIRDEHVRAILVNTGIDVEGIERLDREAETAMKKLLGTRPEESKRPAGALDLSEIKGKLCQPCEAVLLALDGQDLNGNEGERGNPWVLPTWPGPVRIRQVSQGSGSGCAAHAAQPPAEAIFWYGFIPDQTNLWQLWAFTAFEGVYLMHSDDGVFSCKYSDVRISIEMDVFQNYWRGPLNRTLLHRREDNIFENRRFDRAHLLEYAAVLQRGLLAFMRIKVEVAADSKGDWTYSELNFRDWGGYIESIAVAAWV